MYTFTDLSPTLSQLIKFPGKTQQFSIAAEIGSKWFEVGKALLNDERGVLVAHIMSKTREYTGIEEINMEVLSHWVQGKGMADCMWRGLLNVLRVHCPVLAQDIKEILRSEEGSSTYMHDSVVEQRDTLVAIQPCDSATAAALEAPSHATPQPQSGETVPTAGESCVRLKSKIESDIASAASPLSDSVTRASHSILSQTSRPLPPTQPPLPLSKPSPEECFSSAGIAADCALLDEEITNDEHIADIAHEVT